MFAWVSIKGLSHKKGAQYTAKLWVGVGRFVSRVVVLMSFGGDENSPDFHSDTAQPTAYTTDFMLPSRP